MSLRDFFLAAAEHADALLRRPFLVGGKCHPDYKNKASHLATQAITKAMVTEDGKLRLSREEVENARKLLATWQPEYQADVPGRLRWFAGEATRWSL